MLQQIIAQLADERSMFVLEQVIRARNLEATDPEALRLYCMARDDGKQKFALHYHGIDIYEAEQKYFFEDFFALNSNEVLLDGGAYNGDSIREFIKAVGGAFTRVYAVEPNQTLYQTLSQCAKNSAFSGKIEVFSVALSNADGRASFIEDDAASKIYASGTVKVEVVKTGTFISTLEHPPTIIKLDIEGQEVAVLNDMRNFIATHKPKIAVSIYHAKEDLLRIPLLLKEVVPDYRLFIRHKSNSFTETICYAVL